eukprot:12848881-Prorocentrum_lima.AAC.1
MANLQLAHLDSESGCSSGFMHTPLKTLKTKLFSPPTPGLKRRKHSFIEGVFLPSRPLCSVLARTRAAWVVEFSPQCQY